jgi:hypothetical protein
MRFEIIFLKYIYIYKCIKSRDNVQMQTMFNVGKYYCIHFKIIIIKKGIIVLPFFFQSKKIKLIYSY